MNPYKLRRLKKTIDAQLEAVTRIKDLADDHFEDMEKFPANLQYSKIFKRSESVGSDLNIIQSKMNDVLRDLLDLYKREAKEDYLE